MTTWVVGRGGLLGSAVSRLVDEPFDAAGVPWDDPPAAGARLQADLARFRREAGERPWRIVWAAGAATTSTPAAEAMAEVEPLRGLLTALRDRPPAGPGAMFLTSSAGGVYAGSHPAPFDEHSTPVALSAYGELKLAQEHLAVELLAGACPLVIGRVSNLYGPGQNLAKLQGLISRLALAVVTQQPISIFVPLDTIRDYIYVDDAAGAVLAATDAAMGGPAQARTIIIASGQPTTVGQLIRTMGLVTKHRVPVAYGMHASAAAQSLDLRLIPSAGVEASTPLPAGMKAAYLDILDRVQQRSLVS